MIRRTNIREEMKIKEMHCVRAVESIVPTITIANRNLRI